MDPAHVDTEESLREWRAVLDEAEADLAEREEHARGKGDRGQLDLIAQARDDVGAQWDVLAQRHDAWAQQRDMDGLARDKRSSDRDVATRHLAEDTGPAFADRWHSAVDRDDSGGDRADSFDDRGAAADARQRAVGNRERAKADRDAASTSATEHAATIAHITRRAKSRLLIGQASGILMARHGLSPDDALNELLRLAQANNTGLRDAAAAILASAQPE